VPADWAVAGRHVGGSSLGPWLATVQQRSELLSSVAKGHRPSTFALGVLCSPQGLLAAAVQEVARKRAKEGWTLDAVSLASKVMPFDREDAQARKPHEDGVLIHGLLLDGCRWDRQHGRLVEPLPRVLTATLPCVLVTAVLSSTERSERAAERAERELAADPPVGERLQSAAPPSATFACPCYKNPRRGEAHFVFDVSLRSDEPADRWVLRSACVLTQPHA
jgi:hypothetical protein